MELTTSEQILLQDHVFGLKIIRSKKRRRTVALMLKPPNQIIVQAPYKTTLNFINDFITERVNWILTRFQQLKEIPQQKIMFHYVEGEQFPLLGQHYSLRILEQQKVMAHCQLHQQELLVYLKTEANSNQIMKQLHRWYRQQAKQHIYQRMHYWSEQLNIKFNQFFITSAKTRWGSCNFQNDIRINWRLIMLPMALIDYVIVHELCHVRQKNHSPKFWALVEQALPDYKQRQKQLKVAGNDLLFAF